MRLLGLAAGSALALLSTASFAQGIRSGAALLKEAFPKAEVVVDPSTRLPTSIRNLSLNPAMERHASPEAAAMGFFSKYGSNLVDAASGLFGQARVTRTTPDPAFEDRRQVSVQQMFKGVEVYGASATVTVRQAAGQAQFVTDSIRSEFVSLPEGFSTVPAVSADRVREVVGSDYAAMLERSPQAANVEKVFAKAGAGDDAPVVLTIFRGAGREPGAPRLAFRLDKGTFRYMVDAKSAEVIERLGRLRRSYARETSDSMDQPGEFTGVLVLADGMQLVPSVSPEARTAHDLVEQIRQYWLARFARQSWDGRGGTLYSLTRVVVDESMSFGPHSVFGTGYAFSPEIVAHEFTHGLVAGLGKLEAYSHETGALNESISDFYGVAFRAEITGKVDWVIGANVPAFKMLGVAMRNMKNPHQNGFNKAKDYDRKSNNGQPDHFSQYVTGTDRICSTRYGEAHIGCVHANSGILNKSLQLAVEGGIHNQVSATGIGMEKVERILFQALSTEFNKDTRMLQAANGMLSACNNLARAGKWSIAQVDCLNLTAALRATGLL